MQHQYTNINNPSFDQAGIDVLSERLLDHDDNHDDIVGAVVDNTVEGQRPLFISPSMVETTSTTQAGGFVVDDPSMTMMMMMDHPNNDSNHHHNYGNNNKNSTNRNSNNDESGTRGIPEQAQQPEYRDKPFAIAFLIQLMLVIGIAFGWGLGALKHGNEGTTTTSGTSKNGSHDDDSSSVSLLGFIWLCMLTCLVSIGMSVTFLQFMTNHAEQFIQSSLIVSCGLMGFGAMVMLWNGSWVVAILWSIIVAITILYAREVWCRIPFTAANLRTALSAIRTNAGVCVLAYGLSLLANLFLVIWTLAVVGVSYKESSCQNGICQPHMNVLSILLLVLSYHWTTQVLKNVLHVTVSGVVGTWWFAPQDALSVFSPAIQDSFGRATSYSFGSICMGSLLVAIVQFLQTVAKSARRSNGGGIILCIVECILHYVSRIAQYFNKWAMVYVGLYGYDYLTAGRRVMDLFHHRGWSAIINDNLVHRTLVLVSIVIGTGTGLVGIVLARVTGWATAALGDVDDGSSNNDVGGYTARWVFTICFLIGISMAYILMTVVLSAVDTVIVSFAEAPTEFEMNHPALSQNMIVKWQEVYPDECQFQ